MDAGEALGEARDRRVLGLHKRLSRTPTAREAAYLGHHQALLGAQ